MATPPLDDRHRNLRAEYAAANRYSQHLTELNWQVGSILVGGSLAAVAFSLQAKQAGLAPVFVTLAGIIGVTSWYLFLRRNGNYAAIANVRMMYIEQELGLELQGRLNYGVRLPVYPRVSGPTGHENARFLAIGLILVLSSLVIYFLLSIWLTNSEWWFT